MEEGGWRGSTWSSQLTPGYLPDWICSSSHGLSLSRPGCCMLRSELQRRHTSSFTGASRDDFKLLSAAQVESYLVSGHPSFSVLQSEMSMTTMLGLHLQEKYILVGEKWQFYVLQHFRQYILARGLHQGPEGHELKDVA